MKNKDKEKRKDKNNILDIPKEIYTKEPKITMIGFTNCMIENYICIFQYDEDFIKLKTTIGNICIHGINLILDKITEDILKITGEITFVQKE